MSKFAKVKLKNCATFINGMAFKPIDWDVKGLPIVRIQNLTGTNKNFNYYSKEYNPKFEINNGDLLISWSASLGVFIWNGSKAILNQHIFKVVFDKIEINKKYFYFCILDILEEMSEKTHGSAMRHITKGDFDNIEIPLPPLKEQERIVEILDFAFSKIDENIKKSKENLANIDELMQSALQKAFNPLNDNTKENYQLPQNWEWKSLNSVVLKTSNVNPCDFNDDKFYYIDISSIDNKNFCICSIKNINKQYAPSRARKDVLYGDILYATTRPNLKNIAINYYNFNNIVGSTGFCVLRANENLNNKYLFFFLLSDIFDNYISKFIRGAQYPSVSDKDIFNSKIPLPPLQEQEKIAKHLDSVFEKTKALKELYTKELKDYEELKQSLLNKAFKGEL
ncbi:TPA: restriction endonuclease subunit S [Campylobacter jejuni]|nr:restriction endonuclease subunit S [Campylobacter jejuni]EIX0490289.1 restriction endonuclease subunit S [Campylobacter jejuni]MCW1322685.1 restriction endonuclease subunit S [Campylobacter jejuni]HEC1731290.1 restriction endonuclease subunit S [Campylobacter jejuni]HEC2371785.1 restriction endonuclease subunit S [Campylobacter jejuni]